MRPHQQIGPGTADAAAGPAPADPPGIVEPVGREDIVLVVDCPEDGPAVA
ncbi:hypothetical protein [Streptomyces hawaiiensis]|nr:hypothetical protein [Streptomyces hawaiiensis]